MSRHADWLPRVRLSGLVVSEPILEQRWPGGVDALRSGDWAWFRSRYQRWCAASEAGNESGGRAWIDYVLSGLCRLDAERWWKAGEVPESCRVWLDEYDQELRPERVLHRGDAPVLLLSILPLGQHLDRRDRRPGRWRANPAAKLERLLRVTGVELGLLTNGEDWRLVYAPAGQTSGAITWTARGFAQEKPTLDALTTLLQRESVLAESEDDTLLSLCRRSRDRQGEVADQLGGQVREGLEQLLLAWDEADHAAAGRPLRGMGDAAVYEMSLVVMMRFVFLLYAEEKALLPHGEVLYDQGYGLSWLWHRLAEQHRESPASMRHSSDAWLRFLATSRLVHAGCAHPDLSLPAYGGRLFDPTRYPALEHADLKVSNATLYDVLRRLLFARQRRGAELQRVGYWELDVEQIGYVYEGLLDHRCARAGSEPVIKLRGAGEAAMPVTELEKRTDDALIQFVAKESGRKPEQVERGLAEPGDEDLATLRQRLPRDVAERVVPYAGIVQVDEVVEPGRRYLTTGTSRRETGTQYTPQSLTGPVVEGALEPLAYVCEEGKPGLLVSPRRVRPPRELLALKVCDPAMGSGAFLVQVVRYLAERLVESWEQEVLAAGDSARLCLPYAEPVKDEDADEPLPLLLDDADVDRKGDVRERARVEAMRLVAEHCVYGVDINPLAVEMAKLSLWLVTLAKNRPFTFVDHALKCGDSLLGLDQDQVRTWSFDGKGEDVPLLNYLTTKPLKQALALRQELQRITDSAHPEDKASLHRRAEEALAKARMLADTQISAWFMGDSDSERRQKLDGLRERMRRVVSLDRDNEEQENEAEDLALDLSQEVYRALGGRRPFHWFLEFPEVLVDGGGFDGIVGNPPYMGGSRISGSVGQHQFDWVRNLLPGVTGKLDLAVFFIFRALSIVGEQGSIALVTTSRIKDGANAEKGLAGLASWNARLIWALPEHKWAGAAAVRVSALGIWRGPYFGLLRINGAIVDSITPSLTSSLDLGRAFDLAANAGCSYLGAKPDSLGFLLTDDEAEALAVAGEDPAIRRYLVGKDLLSQPHCQGTRWIIDLSEIDLAEATDRFPCSLRVVEERVKPSRMMLKRKAYRDRWWQFTEPQLAAHVAARAQGSVLAASRVMTHFCFAWTDSSAVLADKVVMIPGASASTFAVLSSSIHQAWAEEKGGKHGVGGTFSYSPQACFRSYSFPEGRPTASDPSTEVAGNGYEDHRVGVMGARRVGLTKIYNLFHDPKCQAPDIQRLRDLHVELDNAVLAAYRRHAGWGPLDLQHGWQKTVSTKTKKNRQTGRTEEVEVVTHRFSISGEAREEVLRRLLKLNHERYAEEVKQGLHGKKRGSTPKKKANQSGAKTAARAPVTPPRPKTPRARLPAAVRDSIFARGAHHQVALWFKPGEREWFSDTFWEILRLAARTLPWDLISEQPKPWVLMHVGTVMDFDAAASAFGPGDVEGAILTLPTACIDAAEDLRETLRKAKLPGSVAATCPAPSPERVSFLPWAVLGSGPVVVKIGADQSPKWAERLGLPVILPDEIEEMQIDRYLDDADSTIDDKVAGLLRQLFDHEPVQPPSVPVGQNLSLFGGR